MSRIDDLIFQHCPNGIRTASLGELGVTFGGLTGKSKADFAKGNARFVSYMNVFNNISVNIGSDDFVRIRPGDKQRTLARGDILFTGSSETPEEVGMSSVITAEVGEPLYLNSFCIGYRLNDPSLLEPDFAKHMFRSSGIRKQIVRTASGVTRFNVSKVRLAKVVIPVPPIEVQQEIVRVLDLFTSLDAELEAELEARRQQFAHCLDALVTFAEDGQAKWRTLGELGEFIRGRRFIKSDYVDSGLGCIHYGQIYTDYGTTATKTITFLPEDLKNRLRLARPGDLVIAATGENVEDVCKAVAWLGVDEVAVHDDCFIYRHELNPMYASYLFQSSGFQEQKVRYVSESKVVRISGANMAKIRVQVPPLENQERIVALLNNFDALVNDLSSGLPAEIADRRKQYEYYRDRLLTFKELAA